MAHTCHARDCDAHVRPEYLMCGAHWRKVPRPLQLAVWRHYRPGQCDDMNPSDKWIMAARQAICYVAYMEGRITMKRATKILQRTAEATKIPLPCPIWKPLP